jgi:CubicO group peptidase (beta-lactamase class C family)
VVQIRVGGARGARRLVGLGPVLLLVAACGSVAPAATRFASAPSAIVPPTSVGPGSAASRVPVRGEVPSAQAPVATSSPTASRLPSATAFATPEPNDPASRVASIFTSSTAALTTVGITNATPGCAVAISDGGRTVYAHGFGLANLATREPITPTTVFDVGSVSKQFTAASILLLAQAHRLALTDDIHRFIPELPSYGHALSLQDLLWMESGIPDVLNDGLLVKAGYTDPADRVTIADMLAVIARVTTLEFTPGTQASYSNSNYLLLGIVVQRVSGMALSAFESKEIFVPLGMRSTFVLDDPTAPVANGAISYERYIGGDWTREATAWSTVGPGNVQTTVLDLLTWAGNFTTGTVGGPAFLKAQLRPGPALESSERNLGGDYAMGVVLSTHDGQRIIWHNGSWLGFRSALVIEPATQRALAMACNTSAASDSYDIALLEFDAWFFGT